MNDHLTDGTMAGTGQCLTIDDRIAELAVGDECHFIDIFDFMHPLCCINAVTFYLTFYARIEVYSYCSEKTACRNCNLWTAAGLLVATAV